jgi:hypothetical protein
MRTGALTKPFSDDPDPATFIRDKHKAYYWCAKQYRRLYYLTRLCAGLSAGLLPFVVRESPSTAIVLSILIVLATVVDAVFTPKDHWVLYAKATDLLAAEQLKASGQYEQYKAALRTIEETEAAALKQLAGIRNLIEQGQRDGKRQPPP